MKQILFVVAQAGQAAYFWPVWAKWLNEKNLPFEWKILAHDHAITVLKRTIPACMPYLIESWDSQESLEYMLNRKPPDLIVSSACGKPREIEAAAYANRHKTKHVQVIDSWFKYAPRILSSNPDDHLPDAICVIDEQAKSEAIEGGLPEHRIFCTGHPVWENTLLAPLCIAPKDKVVFASQPLSEIPQMKDIGYDEHDVWAHLINFQKRFPHLITELVYLPHPSQKNIPDSFPAFAKLSKPDENPLYTCGTMVCMFSAIMVEAYIAGQHVIGLQPNLQGENICPLYKNGHVRHITDYNFDALAAAFQDPLPHKKENIKSILKNSTLRLEHLILKHLE